MSPPWLESHADLRDHPKLDLLMELLAITRRDAVGLLHFVWWRTLTYAPSGDLSDFTDGQVARWADWDGEPGQLVSALKTAGFMDSQRMVHDWDEYAGRWIDRRNAEAARKRDARKSAAEHVNGARPPDVRGTSARTGAGHPARVGTAARAPGPDLTGPDLTGPDLTGPDLTGPDHLPPPAPRQRGAAPLTRRNTRAEKTSEAPTGSLTPEEIEAWQRPQT
jgi:hypothetical protein